MLSLLRALVSLGATPQPSALSAAARTGHTEVVRELLGHRLGGLDLNRALLLALEHATDPGRARELVGLLEGAGADACAAQRRGALARNLHGGLAGVLLDALGLRSSAAERNELLQLALGARNCRLAHELLDAGAAPQPGALAPACAAGDEALVRRLLGAGLAARDREALAAAVRSRSGGLLRLLLGAARWPPGDPAVLEALRDACRGGSVECAAELLREGADPAAVGALAVAAAGGWRGLVRLLLGTGRYAGAREPLQSALHEACRSGSAECAEELLAAGADPLEADALGRDALAAAAGKGRVTVVRLLLGTGVFSGQAGPLARALEEACGSGSVECAEELLAAGADPAAADALEQAADAGSAALVRMLLATGRFPPVGAAAAAAAAADGSLASAVRASAVVVKGLLERALLAACERRNNAECIALLLAAGADPTQTDALMCAAAAGGDGASVRLLLGTRRYAAGHPQLARALEEACRGGHLAALRELLRAGANPGPGLVAAAGAGRAGAVRELLRAGSAPARAGLLGDALAAACGSGHVDAAQALLEGGADPVRGLRGAVGPGGSPELLRALLATGRCPPGHPDMAAALAAACSRRPPFAPGRHNTELVQQLLSAGADPGAGLSAAVQAGSMELLRQLLATAGRCRTDRRNMDAAVATACRVGSWSACEALLRAGADPLAGLAVAVDCGNAWLVRRLLAARRPQADADAAAAARRGGAEAGGAAADGAADGVKERINRALWSACYQQCVGIVTELLAAGADPAAALGCPTLRGNPELRQVLLAAAGGSAGVGQALAAASEGEAPSEFDLMLLGAGLTLSPVATSVGRRQDFW